MKKRTGLVFMPLLILSVMSSCGRKQDGSIMVIPIRETNDEVTLTIEKGDTLYVADIRLAAEGEEADYFVPLDLKHFGASKRDVHFSGVEAAQAWKLISFSDTPPAIPEEKYRPVYHHTPPYGWMNDANGLFYK
ncbi:MAG: DUF4980 domain-containing protein, partial [Bacteroidales bacterium]|nr:DUF4980 domain-containing protein [Bacteroidales bacterium]